MFFISIDCHSLLWCGFSGELNKKWVWLFDGRKAVKIYCKLFFLFWKPLLYVDKFFIGFVESVEENWGKLLGNDGDIKVSGAFRTFFWSFQGIFQLSSNFLQTSEENLKKKKLKTVSKDKKSRLNLFTTPTVNSHSLYYQVYSSFIFPS